MYMLQVEVVHGGITSYMGANMVKWTKKNAMVNVNLEVPLESDHY